MRKHIVYNTINFQPVTVRILFFRGIQTLQMRLSREACFLMTTTTKALLPGSRRTAVYVIIIIIPYVFCTFLIWLYTGCPPPPKKKKTTTTNNNKTTEQSIFQDFALINSYLFSPCWIEHLFLIMITPRSSNLVDSFLFYE